MARLSRQAPRRSRSRPDPAAEARAEADYRAAEERAARATRAAYARPDINTYRMAAACHRVAADLLDLNGRRAAALGHRETARKFNEEADAAERAWLEDLRKIAPDLEADVNRIVASSGRRGRAERAR